MWIDKKLTPAVNRIKGEDQIQRYLECVYNPLVFASYCKIKNSTTNRIEPFRLWPHQQLLLLKLASRKTKRKNLFKSKQIGCSWTVGGIYHLWRFGYVGDLTKPAIVIYVIISGSVIILTLFAMSLRSWTSPLS